MIVADPQWTTVEDLQNAWVGDPLQLSADTIKTWLARAERRLVREIPGLAARLEQDEPDLRNAVADAVLEMVETKFRNPEGARTRQESTGPFGGSITYGGDNPGGLVVTEQMRKSLAPPERAGEAFEVDLLANRRHRVDPLYRAHVNGPDWRAPRGDDDE